MKKSIQCIGIIAVLALMAACSNKSSNNSLSSTGTVTFFHYVSGSSTLSLESVNNDRGLGTVEFEKFGSGIDLSVKTWDLTVTDVREESDASDDVTVLEDSSFPVTRNRTIINALIGDYELDTVELVTLSVAHDDEEGDDDNNLDGIADDKAQFINFSHIHSELGPLDIYLVEPAQSGTSLNLLTPTATIDFKESSESVRLDENITKYVLRVALHSAPTVEIYNSGEKTLKDYLDQTIIIAPYTGAVNTGSQITAFYYGNGNDQKWLATNSQGQVRVYNALLDSVDMDYDLTSSGNPTLNVDSNLLFKDMSPYQFVDTSAITYVVTPNDFNEGSAFFDGIGPAIDVQDGESWTVIFFGHVAGFGTSAAIKVLEEDNRFSNKATFTFSNVAYIADIDLRLPVNVHVKLKTDPLDSDIPKFKLLAYGNHGSTTLNAVNNYEIWVTSQDELNTIAGPETFDVEGGENFHFVLIENNAGGTPFQIVQLIGEASAERTTITAADSATTAGGAGTEITVQAKDRGANKLIKDGDVVTLASSGNGSITAVMDNNDGTYTATITDATAETVTITGTINGDAIVDTETVVFTAP